MLLTFDKTEEKLNKKIYIEIINSKTPIKISIFELIEKLETLELFTRQLISKSQPTISTETHAPLTQQPPKEQLECEKEKSDPEPQDRYVFMNDEELINETEKVLILSKKYGIEEYYRQNNLKYRPFNLGGLYSKKQGIKSEKQRYMIRELVRTCQQFLESDSVSKKREQEISKKIELEFNKSIQSLEESSKKLEVEFISIQKMEEIKTEIKSIEEQELKSTEDSLIETHTKDDISGNKVDEYIYIIREREFKNSNQDVYKIGRTGNFMKRFLQYPKNSELIFVSKVIDSVKKEKEIIQILKKNLKQRRDIGIEYFEGKQELLVEYVKEITG